MARLFGTDGVRGVANGPLHDHPHERMDAHFALDLGRAARATGARRAVVGQDTRRSGSVLASALAAGLAGEGVEVVLGGVLPTPAVSHAVRTGGFDLGVVVSASHNPAPDNGIKFFGPDGRKLDEAAEDAVEKARGQASDAPTGAQIGTVRYDEGVADAYREWLVGLVPDRLDGLRIVVDAANGAASRLGPEVLRRLGADVTEINTDPGDGTAINAAGGATMPRVVRRATQEAGADVGVAFDGDADRAVFSDRHGRLVNGDRVLALWAGANAKPGEVVVGTVMSNTGFERYLSGLGVELARAKVGDKYVSALMAERGARAGGEQSGHTIFAEHAPTGDGLLTLLQVLRALRGRSLEEAYDDFANWPQFLVNVRVASKAGLEERIASERDAVAALLGPDGRVNVRPSGTSPTVRVMVEAADEGLAREATARLVATVEREMDGKAGNWTDLRDDLGD